MWIRGESWGGEGIGALRPWGAAPWALEPWRGWDGRSFDRSFVRSDGRMDGRKFPRVL